MSGGKSSSTQQQETTFTDNRAALGEGSIQAREGSTVNSWTLDGGAINRAFNTADLSVDRALSFGGQALDFGDRALQFSAKQTAVVLDNLQDTQQLTANAYNDAKGRGALTDKLLIFAVGSMAIVAALAVKK